jgi:transposase-like protein
MIPLIQALIPLGLQAFAEVMQAEVAQRAGRKYSRTGGQPNCVRWGRQPGSIFLADQKGPVTVQRVRDRARCQEFPLQSYQQLQTPRHADGGLFRKVLAGLSCRDYAASAEAVPEAFGLSVSSVSRRFIRASAKQLQVLLERRLDDYDLVALLLDGKTCAADAMVVALGVTLTGEKVILGFVQTATENARVCAASGGTRASSAWWMAPRGCGRRSPASSARRRPCNGANGPSASTRAFGRCRCSGKPC